MMWTQHFIHHYYIYACIVEIAILITFLNVTNVSLSQNTATMLCFRLKISSLLLLTALLA